MSEHKTCFPDDLKTAWSLKSTPLSFSTIQLGDKGPTQVKIPFETNSGGSVGLIVDISEISKVVSVGLGDDGTRAKDDGNHQTGGGVPTQGNREASIDNREDSNEWFVQDYHPVGIFVFWPISVFVRNGPDQGERPAKLDEVLTAFPQERIISENSESFVEFNRSLMKWEPIDYTDIIPD